MQSKFARIFQKFKKRKDQQLSKNLTEQIKETLRGKGEVPETTFQYYQIIKLLGKGSFGKVFLGIQKLTNRLCAIKTINKNKFKKEKRKRLKQEVQFLRMFLGHPNVIKILEVFENDSLICFVMEYAPSGDLLNYLR